MTPETPVEKRFPGRRAARWLAAAALALGAGVTVANVAPSAPAPDFALRSVGGPNLRLKEQRGQVVMVNFWATWCGVCKAEMPGWQKYYEANKGRGFELIAMSIDEEQDELRKHAAKNASLTFPIAWRWDDATDDNFGDIIGTPTLYVLDKSGKVAWMKRGRVTQEQLAAAIEPLLK
jgi:thiol-disulfide isomerase/thioredoxin